MPTWDVEVYETFAAERGRPFTDLLARVAARDPREVVDLGCGPGGLTAGLATRWPTARVTGVDSSEAMITAAQAHVGPQVGFVLGDLAEWRPERPADVVVSNAALQWVPEHRHLLPGLVDALAPGGWLAFQVPGNHDAPSHRALREVATEEPFAPCTARVVRPRVAEPEEYLDDLAGLGCRVDAWETTYLHVLRGPDPVLRWLEGTGARPYLDVLPAELRPTFTDALRERLAAVYPAHPWGTALPFRRIFVVARKPGTPASEAAA